MEEFGIKEMNVVKFDYKNTLRQLAVAHRNAVVEADKIYKAKPFRIVLIMSNDTLEALKAAGDESFFFNDPTSETFESVSDFWYPLNSEASAGCPVRLGFMPHLKFRMIAEEGNYK